MGQLGTRLVVIGISTVLWILPLEWWARSWIEHSGDPLDRSMAVLRIDPLLGWRQREHFRGTFMDVPLETNELGLRNPPLASASDADVRILIAGPSSTFGWGVPEELTYARQLERLLRGPLAGASVSVTNAGEIGFTSWQGAAFFRNELRSLRPDLVIVAYGANDVDRHRFFFDDPRPDHVALASARSPSAVAWQNAVGRLRFFHVARRGVARLLGRFSCAMGSPSESSPPLIPSLRVPPDDYARNLREIISLAREDGAKVLLMTTGFLLEPFPEASEETQHQDREMLDRGMRHLRVLEFAEAAEVLNRSLRTNPHQCEIHYALAFSHAALGDCAAAREAVRSARAAEPPRVERDLRTYNRVARELAAASGVPLIDTQAIVTSDGPPDVLFLDPVHFTAKGHARIARALFDSIMEMDIAL